MMVEEKKISILHTNDFHGKLGEVVLAKLRPFREAADLYFDCGDCVKAGNLAIPISPEVVWSRLAALNCTGSVPGNRESHILESAFHRKMEGAVHPILCANMRDRKGELVLPESLILEVNNIRIGVFGVMVAMVTSKKATSSFSAFLWDAPIPAAERVVASLRSQVDCVIALTHIGLTQDRLLASKVSGIDLILGGHSHNVLVSPERIQDTWIAQTGSHARFAGTYVWTQGVGITSYQLSSLQ